MSEDDGPLRLGAVAALLDLDLGASRAAQDWIGLDGEPCSQKQSELIVSATGEEQRLAEALRGSAGMDVPEPDAEAIAGLLRLADGSRPAPVLAASLLQTFLIPDDSRHAPARDDRAATFAELYRTLALPGMAPAAADRAVTLLASVG